MSGGNRLIPRFTRTIALVMCWLALVAVAGCEHSTSTLSALPTTKMEIGSRTYTLEIADDEKERAKGLMQRDSMPPDHGMIFVFEEERELSFWMKNTRIPLDIIFISAAGDVVSTARMEPYDLKGASSQHPAKYAIELNAGEIAANGLKVGASLRIPPEAREPAKP